MSILIPSSTRLVPVAVAVAVVLAFALVPLWSFLRELLVAVRRIMVRLTAVLARGLGLGLRLRDLVRLTDRRTTEGVLEFELRLDRRKSQVRLSRGVEDRGNRGAIGIRHLGEEPVDLEMFSDRCLRSGGRRRRGDRGRGGRGGHR